MAVQTQIQTRRGTAASWTSTNPTLAAGEIGFETDTGKFKIGNGSTAWASLAYSAGATAVTYLFNATGGQTTFSGADANGLTLAYTVGAEQVYLNGVLQVRGSDYTATNGTSIVLTSGALVSDVLNVIAYSAMTITDTYTQAQADAKFFQTANAFLAGKNKIINGDFGVWQRGTSFSATGYAADRWLDQSQGTLTISQQTFSPGTAPVAGYEGTYFLREVRSGGAFSVISQRIEDVRTFAGKSVTLSYWMKTSSGTITNSPDIIQNFGSGGSGAVTAAATPSTATVTTSWQRFTHTFNIASIAGKTIGTSSYLEIRPLLHVSGTGATIDIWGVQLEVGSIATPFQTATGTLQGELAACQRYYWRSTQGNAFSTYGLGIGASTTVGAIPILNPVTMRVSPTSVDFANLQLSDYGGNAYTVTSLAMSIPGAQQTMIDVTTAGVMVALRSYILRNNNNTAGYLGFSAEL
jgi:hypothetical protein